MAEKLLGEEKKRMEREDIINTLHEEEKKISMQAKLRKQSLEKQRLAKELLEDMLRQKKAINERKAKKIALDNDFTQYIVEQNRIDIKQEQDKIQERRLRGLYFKFLSMSNRILLIMSAKRKMFLNNNIG